MFAMGRVAAGAKELSSLIATSRRGALRIVKGIYWEPKQGTPRIQEEYNRNIPTTVLISY